MIVLSMARLRSWCQVGMGVLYCCFFLDGSGFKKRGDGLFVYLDLAGKPWGWMAELDGKGWMIY